MGVSNSVGRSFLRNSVKLRGCVIARQQHHLVTLKVAFDTVELTQAGCHFGQGGHQTGAIDNDWI